MAQSPKQLRSPVSDLLASGLEVSSKDILISGSDFCWHYALFFLNRLSWPSSLAFDFFGLRIWILDFQLTMEHGLALLLESVCSSATLSFCPWSQWLTASDSCSHPKNPLVSWNSWSGEINCPVWLPLILAFFPMCCHWPVWPITLDFCDLNSAARGHIILFASWLLLDLTFFRLPCLISHGTFCPISGQFWVLGVFCLKEEVKTMTSLIFKKVR